MIINVNRRCKIKLFHWNSVSRKKFKIHALNAIGEFSQPFLCGMAYAISYDFEFKLDYTKGFCNTCTKILKDDHNIDIKQLAINQKLGVK